MAPHRLCACLITLTVLLCAALLPGCGSSSVKDGGEWRTTINNQPFTLKVSASDPTRQRGLGGVTDIPADGGMVFVFPDAQARNFYMKDCVTNMDIVFLDSLGYITAIYTMTQEPLQGPNETTKQYEERLRRYNSLSKAQFVLELREGRAKELGLKTQQKLPLDFETLKTAAQ